MYRTWLIAMLLLVIAALLIFWLFAQKVRMGAMHHVPPVTVAQEAAPRYAREGATLRPMRAYLASQRILATNVPGGAIKLRIIGIRQANALEEIGFVAFATAQTGLVSAGGLTWIKSADAVVASFQINRVMGAADGPLASFSA